VDYPIGLIPSLSRVPAESDHDRIRGAMLGLAVGDALGAPLEGAPPAIAAPAVARGLEMTGGGWWAPGEWTDDTAMALELAESIGALGVLDTDDLADRYIRWATTDGKGIGRTTRSALVGARDAEHARARARAHYETMELAAGNGTVMRATPIGIAAHDLEEAVDAARRDAQLTHADPAASAASAALCAALLAVREGADPLAAARGQSEKHPGLAGALDAVGGPDESALGQLAAGQGAGACWTTLAVALHALLVIDDYQRGVSWAIAQGGDTDTNAAVTGALLGYRHGASQIPARWLRSLRGRGRLERAAQALSARAG
jgi:ADP-ribosyl-[dinitrogen reductase] hydrolase